jgi:glycosyltransferase involved in cell wall biosynthesis
MSKTQTVGLTSGYLPLTAFRHFEPSTVAVVDLDQAMVLSRPGASTGHGVHRDGLLLIRLHDEPLAVVHVDRDPAGMTKADLADEIWRLAGAEIRRHVERFHCAATPNTADALLDGLHVPANGCPGNRLAVPRASAAVIVCTVGREQQLGRCLRALLAQRKTQFELIVVDNRPASGDALRTVRSVAAGDERVRYVPEPRVGLSVARNRGVCETDAEIVAFTDDDVVADPCWLAWLLAPFSESEVTATSGMVLPLELETEAQKRFEQYGGFSKGMERKSYGLRTGRVAGRPLYPFLGDVFGGGNSMAFRRGELVAAGGFDTALGAGSPTGGGEDIWALSTAILRGGHVVYEPRSLCWHEHRRDGDALRGQVFGYGVGLGAILTKALADPRFYMAAGRFAMTVLASRRDGRGSGPSDEAPIVSDSASTFRKELLRAHREGIIHGPLRYLEGVVRSHRLGLGDVIRGG